MRRPLTLAAWLSCGCAGGEETADEPLVPSEYSYTPEGDADTAVDLAAVEVALDGMFRELRSLNAAPALTSYDNLIVDSDDYCPQYYEQDGSTFWYATCTAGSGASYDGYAFYTVYDDVDLLGDGNDWDAVVMSGSADMVSPDGHLTHLGGTSYLAEAVADDGALLWYSVVAGAFYSEDPAVSSTWIAGGATPTMSIYAGTYDEYGINIIYLSGSAALTGEVTAFSTDSLVIYSYTPGFYPCPEEPAGTISIRDARGSWYDITFDIDPNTFAVDSGECDGCGMVTRGSEVIGEVCVDASTLVDWENTPW